MPHEKGDACRQYCIKDLKLNPASSLVEIYGTD